MVEYLLMENRGVVSRAQLLGAGVEAKEITTLVKRGTVERLRPGWFRGDPAQPEVVRAVRAGGVLACRSALRLHGVWVPADGVLHIRRSEHHSGTSLPSGYRECHPYPRCTARIVRSVDPFPLALQTALRCADDDTSVVLMDSALRRGLIESSDLSSLLGCPSDRAFRLIDRIDVAAESGTETYVRLRLRRRGVRLRSQVTIADVGRVDFLVGDRLVIEVDSRAHHTSEEAYARDRRRDRRLVALGYIVIRLTYEDVLFQWPEAEADILTVLRARRHRWPRRSAG